MQNWIQQHSHPRNAVIPRLLTAILCLIVAFSLSDCDSKPLYLSVPYVTTPDFVVDKMLSLARVDSGDYVIDLGSGDGRIVIAAAKRGAAGHGVDIDPERVSEAQINAQNAGVADRVLFFRENIFRTNFSEASVVTMFLLTTINEQLRPKLLNELRPGTRVVSHKFGMGDWAPDRHIALAGPSATTFEIFMWIIPASAEGSWTGQLNDDAVNIQFTQKYQNISAELTLNGDSLHVRNSTLRGSQIALTALNDDVLYQLSGIIEGDTLSGYFQEHNSGTSSVNSIQLHRNTNN